MRASRADWFDGWLRVLFVLLWLLAWFLLSTNRHSLAAWFISTSLSYFLR